MEPTFQPQAAFTPVTVADSLRVTSFCSVASVVLNIQARVLDDSGHIKLISQSHAPNSDRSANNTFIPLLNGYLLSVSITVQAGTIVRGQCFARVSVQRSKLASAAIHDILISNYVASSLATAWPAFGAILPSDGHGAIKTVVSSTPAAGSNGTETVPDGALWKLLSVKCELATDANAANRHFQLTITDGTNVLFRMPADSVQTANTTELYYYIPGLGFADGTLDHQSSLFIDIRLAAGSIIKTEVAAIEDGDQIDNFTLLIEEWINP